MQLMFAFNISHVNECFCILLLMYNANYFAVIRFGFSHLKIPWFKLVTHVWTTVTSCGYCFRDTCIRQYKRNTSVFMAGIWKCKAMPIVVHYSFFFFLKRMLSTICSLQYCLSKELDECSHEINQQALLYLVKLCLIPCSRVSDFLPDHPVSVRDQKVFN